MCNDKPIKKRRGRGPAKPTRYELERRLRYFQWQTAIKDRPPGCKCAYRGDTCKVCRPHLYGIAAACAVFLLTCCPSAVADPHVELIVQRVSPDVVIATGSSKPVIVATEPGPDTAVVICPEPVQPPIQARPLTPCTHEPILP
jgi:hypothetical protein